MRRHSFTTLSTLVVALVTSVAVSFTCVTPAHADTFSNDSAQSLRNDAQRVMNGVQREAARAGLDTTIFTNDSTTPTTLQPSHYGGMFTKDDSYNSSGIYRGYSGNVNSPALENDSEAGRYFRRKNTGASIPAKSCQASLTNLLPNRQIIPNPKVEDVTGMDMLLNGPGLDAILTAVKQAQEPYMSEWASQAARVKTSGGQHDPYGEEKSRASQRYHRRINLTCYGLTPQQCAERRALIEEAEKAYWMDQMQSQRAHNSLWIPLTIAILSGDAAKVRATLSFLPTAARDSIINDINAIDVSELTFLLETGIILMQDILILIKFIVVATIQIIIWIIEVVVTEGVSLADPNIDRELAIMNNSIQAAVTSLKVAQQAIVDILRIGGRMMMVSQKYIDPWTHSSFLPNPGDLANALDPYTQMGHDFYCLLPPSLNQSRTIVTSGYAISVFMKTVATTNLRPVALQMQRTADDLDNMKRYSTKIMNKGVGAVFQAEKKLGYDPDQLGGGGQHVSSTPHSGFTGGTGAPVSNVIPGNGGTTFTNNVDNTTSNAKKITPITSKMVSVSTLKAIPDLHVGSEAAHRATIAPVSETALTPSLDSVIPQRFPTPFVTTPALYAKPTPSWGAVQDSAIVDASSVLGVPVALIRKMIHEGGVLSAELPRLIKLALSTPKVVADAGSDDFKDDDVDMKQMAFFITDLSRTLYDSIDLFMIARSFIVPYITSFMNMAFMLIVLNAPGKNDIPVVGHALNLLAPATDMALYPLASIVNSPEFVRIANRNIAGNVGNNVMRILIQMGTRAEIVGDVATTLAFPEDARRDLGNRVNGGSTDVDIYSHGVPLYDNYDESTSTSTSMSSQKRDTMGGTFSNDTASQGAITNG